MDLKPTFLSIRVCTEIIYAIYIENRKVIIMDRRVYEAVKKSEERSRRYKLNRQRQIRRRLLGLATALCLAVIIATGTHTLISSAHTADAEQSYKYYTSISVAYGDTLTSIAGEYMDEHYTLEEYISEVRQINHLSEDASIDAGSYLVVPYYSSEWK